MTHTLPDKFKVPRAFWKGLEAIGLSPVVLLHQARLPATLHMRDTCVVTTAQCFALWRAAEQLIDSSDSAFAFVTKLDPAVLPPSSLVAFYARDYRDGLTRMARFKQLCAPERMDVVEEGDNCVVSIEWLYATEDEPLLLTDISFAAFVELGRKGTGAHIVPRRIELKAADDKNSARRNYFGCPIRFRASRNALILKAEDLDRPFPSHNPELVEMLSPVLGAALEELTARSSVGDQVKTILKRLFASGRPELAYVARELGMSERTLQRRITGEGKTFRQLLLEARQDVVQSLLREHSVEINEVAYLLGYDDANSFYRAFRSWQGITPAQWRQLQS